MNWNYKTHSSIRATAALLGKIPFVPSLPNDFQKPWMWHHCLIFLKVRFVRVKQTLEPNGRGTRMVAYAFALKYNAKQNTTAAERFVDNILPVLPIF